MFRLFRLLLGIVWAANDPQQPESGWQERSAAFAGAILIERSGNRLANEPAIRARPNAHPASKLRRIHMSFVLRERWHCTFMEQDLRTQAAPARTFTNPDNMVEMIRRGNGLRDLASKQTVEDAIMTDRGNVDLLLTPEQYERLVG